MIIYYFNQLLRYKKSVITFIVLNTIISWLAGCKLLRGYSNFIMSGIVFWFFFTINLAVLLLYVILFNKIFEEKYISLTLNFIKRWVLFVILLLVLKLSAFLIFSINLQILPISLFLIYVAMFVHKYLKPNFSRRVYMRNKLHPDKWFSELFHRYKTGKCHIRGEIRNSILLKPSEIITFDLEDNINKKIGIGITKGVIVSGQNVGINFFSSSNEKIGSYNIMSTNMYEGWHDICFSSGGYPSDTHKIQINNSRGNALILSYRKSKYIANPKYILVIVLDAISLNIFDKNTAPNTIQFFSNNSSEIYTNAFTQAEWTLPAFASIMTSLYPSHHKVYDPDIYSNILPENIKILPEILQREKFSTFGYVSHKRCGYAYGYFRGFDEFIYRQTTLKDTHSYRDIINRALVFLQEYKNENKFLFLHYFDTHQPFFLPLNKDIKMDGKDLEEKLRCKIKEVDTNLKSIFDFLSQEKIRKNVMVILTSDHGANLQKDKGPEIDINEARIKVPFLVYCPWKINDYSVNDMMVEASIDIMPTILDVLNIPLPEYAEGKSVFLSSDKRKGYIISESIYKDKYEIVKRSNSYKVYARLKRDRKKDRLIIEKDIKDYLRYYNSEEKEINIEDIDSEIAKHILQTMFPNA